VVRLATVGVALAVLALSGCGGGGTLSKEELQKQYEAIQSLAAEGALVADGVADDRTTETFVAVHSQYLSEAARKVETDLRSGNGPQQAVSLARRVAEDLDRLHEEPDDPVLARRLSEQLQASAADAEERAK
jgi:hypothetical protein